MRDCRARVGAGGRVKVTVMAGIVSLGAGLHATQRRRSHATAKRKNANCFIPTIFFVLLIGGNLVGSAVVRVDKQNQHSA